jgi:hypothetical protein
MEIQGFHYENIKNQKVPCKLTRHGYERFFQRLAKLEGITFENEQDAINYLVQAIQRSTKIKFNNPRFKTRRKHWNGDEVFLKYKSLYFVVQNRVVVTVLAEKQEDNED